MKRTILVLFFILAAPLAAQDFDLKHAQQELGNLLWQAGGDTASVAEIEAALLRATNLLHNWQGAGSDPDETPLPDGQRPTAVLVASLEQMHQVYQNLMFGRGASLSEALVLCDSATVRACDQALDRLFQTGEEPQKLRIYQRLTTRLLAILLEREANAAPWELVRKLTAPEAELTSALQRAGVEISGEGTAPEVSGELVALRDENFRLALQLEAAQEANSQLTQKMKARESQEALAQDAWKDLQAENLAIKKAAAEQGSNRQLIFLLLVAGTVLIGFIGWCVGWATGQRQARGRPL